MSRRRLLAIVVLPTLLVGALVAALFGLDAVERREDVQAADHAAMAFQTEVGVFRDALGERLGAVELEDVAEVAAAVTAAREDVPVLGDVPERGASESGRYQEALAVRAGTLDGLDELEALLGDAEQAREFVAGATRALSVDPRDFLASESVPDGGPVRAGVLPPLRAALAQFEGVAVPDDAEATRDEVRGALQFVIGEAETLAAELDAGRGYQFEFGTRYGEAEQAVQQYRSGREAALREAADRVVGEPAATT